MNIEELADKLETVVTQAAPVVTEAALKVVAVDGGIALLTGLGLALVGVCLLVLCNKILSGIPETLEKGRDYSSSYFGITMFSLIGLGFTIGGFTRLLNIWHWVAVFDPELALARQLMNSVL